MPEIFAYVISNLYNKPPRWALLSVLISCGKIDSEEWSASQCLITIQSRNFSKKADN